MTATKLPSAIEEKSFEMFGVKIRCYVLDDGQRVLDADDTQGLFAAMENTPQSSVFDQKAYADLLTFLRGGTTH
jgi:hypothetical protein